MQYFRDGCAAHVTSIVNSMALIIKRLHFIASYQRFGARFDKSKYPTQKDDDIFKMFHYLKALPTPRQSIDKAAKLESPFIVHRRRSTLMNLRNKHNDPYINAMYSIHNFPIIHSYLCQTIGK